MTESVWRRLSRPPDELLRRVRWVLLYFVPLSLVPWFIALARQDGRGAEALAVLAVAVAGFAWARAYLADVTPPWWFDVLHLPLVVVVLVSAPPRGEGGFPGGPSVFTVSMLLQMYGGRPWRMLLRAAVTVGALFIAGAVLGAHVQYTAFGVSAASLFAWMLGAALERQRVSLQRARRLTAAAAGLAASRRLEDVARVALDAVLPLAGAVRARLAMTVPGDEAARLELASGPSDAPAPHPVEVRFHDERGVDGLLRVELAERPDAELPPALTTLLTAAVQAVARLRLQQAQHEMDIASKLQAALLPRRFQVPGFDVAGVMLPASDVGGDYFDVLPTERGCFVGIGDVAGHGLSAGLVMLMTQSVVSALARGEADVSPSDVVVRLNQVLYDNVHLRLGRTEHVTFNLLRFERDGTVVHAGAHEDVLVLRAATGALERLATSGTWIGASPDVARVTKDSRFALEPGDVVLLHTDGITEARADSREQFGLERLEEGLRDARHLGAEATVKKLLALVRGWTERRDDDWSLLVVRYLGPEARAQPFHPERRPELV